MHRSQKIFFTLSKRERIRQAGGDDQESKENAVALNHAGEKPAKDQDSRALGCERVFW